jgi:hypothetical protein
VRTGTKATLIFAVALIAILPSLRERYSGNVAAPPSISANHGHAAAIPLARDAREQSSDRGYGPFAAPSAPAYRPQIATEVLYSTDVRATYEKYRSSDDPTGEIAYFLFKALDDCTPFAHRTPRQVAEEMNARRQPIGGAERSRLIRESIDRCKGFAEWDHVALIARVEELRQEAAAAGYPAAVATTLPRLLWTQGLQRADEVAVSLLSGDVDGDVVQGVYHYLLARNGNEWFAGQGSPSASFAAWTLLECNMGADCGARSRPVITACLYFGACEQHEVVTVLPVMDPGLDPARLQEAIAIETTLGNAIRNHDWVRLGFAYPRKIPDTGSVPSSFE